MRIPFLFLFFFVFISSAFGQVTIEVINYSRIADSTVQRVIVAMNTQIERDFYPVWNMKGRVVLSDSTNSKNWKVFLYDQPLRKPALGFHYVDSLGIPCADVWMWGTWTSTLSHELLETLSNPYCNQLVVIGEEGDTAVKLYDFELVDPCQDDAYGYYIDGILVSDFIYPAWFTGKGEKYDHMGHIKNPLEVLRDSHAINYEVELGPTKFK